jgi:hypothetical protein
MSARNLSPAEPSFSPFKVAELATHGLQWVEDQSTSPEAARLPDPPAKYTLGDLIQDLRRFDLRYRECLRAAEQNGPIAGNYDRIQAAAEATEWCRHLMRIPGISRLREICNRSGEELSIETIRRFRGQICKSEAVTLTQADNMTVNTVAVYLEVVATRLEDFARFLEQTRDALGRPDCPPG